MQLEKLVKKVTDLPDDLKTKISLIPSQGALPRASAVSRKRQHEIMLQMDILSKLVHEHLVERSRKERVDSDRTNSTTQNLGPSTVPVFLALAIGCIGILAYNLK
ncbi:hypothetical protein Rs2_23810 [Raphanus sativus]|nr:hypothetical protein Rs2_23810 [Raphanus sativus]